MDLQNLRRDYLNGGLRRADLHEDPIQQFEQWLSQAIQLKVKDPTAMVVATVSASGQPSQRVVLLKHLDANGLVFFTNYRSRKARDLEGNPRISLLFPWQDLDRQVKVCGEAEKTSTEESLAYFLSRPRDSQLAAWASAQSSPIESRDALLAQLQQMKNKFTQDRVPLPDFWGGIRVRPQQMEFWQGGASRLHDRFEYNRQEEGGWSIRRLAP